MAVFNAQDLSVAERQKLITGGIGPRPIALVSTLSDKGVANVSPFSFFNAFGANPPIVAFSPARRGRDGSLKDTYFNCKSTGECTISMVSFAMVEQVSLASTEYEESVDEFVKSGLEKAASTLVKPSGVADSPFWMECKVLDIIHTGKGNGAGNIVLCEILAFHVADTVIDEHLQINPHLSDVVGRYGGADYVRASGSAIFSIPKPTAKGLGFDALPAFLLKSTILTANNLARLANRTEMPSQKAAEDFLQTVPAIEYNRAEFERAERNSESRILLAMAKSSQSKLHFEKAIKAYLDAWKEDEAWAIVVSLANPL